MQNASTPILTGHLNEYPLPDIIDILRHQRKTGRLFIDYPATPGQFFFADGDLVEAQVGVLKGVQAAELAVSLPDSPFNFDPLAEPPARTVGNMQEVVLSALGCLEDELIHDSGLKSEVPVAGIRAAGDVPDFKRRVLRREITPKSDLAIGNPDPKDYRNLILSSAGAMLLGVAFGGLVAVTDAFGTKPAPAPARVGQSETKKPQDKATVIDSSDGLMGAPGYPAEAHEDGPIGVVVKSGEKVRQPPRAQASNDSQAEAKPLPAPAPSAAPDKKPAGPPNVDKVTSSADQTITVVTQVEDGRVVGAYVANRRPGMEAFEASALRAARQRHFPPGTKGSEKVQIKVGNH